jgi:hypothetical protein
MSVIGDISRALVCASFGHRLISADLSGIESRLTAWVSGQESKIQQWATFDRTGNPEDEPYFISGHKIFGLPKAQARDPGKTGDLAFGYMGGKGAWQKLAPPGDASTEIQIKQRQQAWRRAHPQTVEFWHALNRAAKTAMRLPGKIVPCRGLALHCCEDSFLRMKLPNGREIAYPFPTLKPNRDGESTVVFMDNQKGKWVKCRNGQGAYGGTWTENAVQAIGRDLFIEAMQRLEAAGYSIVLHAHDEAVAEVPADFGSIEEFKQIFTELPAWATGLPVAAKARISYRFCKIAEPNTTTECEPEDETASEGLTNDDDDDEPANEPGNATINIESGVPQVSQAAKPARRARPSSAADMPVTPPSIVTPRRISLVELIGEVDADGNLSRKIHCPFHDDGTPSLHVYDDHFHCYGCGAHGDAVDWLMIVEGLDRGAALHLIEHGAPNQTSVPPSRLIEASADQDAKRRRALQLWRQARPITGTLAERYLIERRGIDLAALPDAAACLRFHARCPFGPEERHPCLIALRRDAITDEPVSIQRIALTPETEKTERRMLGRGGVVKHAGYALGGSPCWD